MLDRNTPLREITTSLGRADIVIGRNSLRSLLKCAPVETDTHDPGASTLGWLLEIGKLSDRSLLAIPSIGRIKLSRLRAIVGEILSEEKRLRNKLESQTNSVFTTSAAEGVKTEQS